MNRLLLILCLAVMLSACSKTVVVLVPDEEGKVGQVSVASAEQKTLLRGADESVGVTSKTETPRQMSPKVKEKLFGRALAAEPKAPLSFLLYFQPNSNTPDLSSGPDIRELVQAVKARSLPQVSVIGHTDTVGDDKINNELSIARARGVRQLLIDNGLDPGLMRVYSFGKRDLLVPTGDNVSEPRNRRVEIFVR